MATLTVQVMDSNGLTASYASSGATGDKIANPTEDIFLHFKNTASGVRVATITTPGTVHGVAVAEEAVTVPATGEQFAGPFNKDIFNSGGNLVWTYSSVVNLSVAAIRVKRI